MATLRQFSTPTGPGLYEVLVIKGGAPIECGYNPHKSEYTLFIPDILGGVTRKEILGSKASKTGLKTLIKKNVPVAAMRKDALEVILRTKAEADESPTEAARLANLAAVQGAIRALEARLAG